jgi:hypothetical protein
VLGLGFAVVLAGFSQSRVGIVHAGTCPLATHLWEDLPR